MADINVASVPVTTFVAKRQKRRISEKFNSKNQVAKEPSIVTELTFEDTSGQHENDLKTPDGKTTAASKEVLILDPPAAVSPSLRLYFEGVDKVELAVEDADEDDN